MDEILATVIEVVGDVARQQLGRVVVIKPETDFLEDLSFASLDYAEIVAILETRLGVDPFKEGSSLERVRTVDDLAQIYVRLKASGGTPDRPRP